MNDITKQSAKYGLIVGVCVLFVGWVTGIGGSLLPNLIFSVLMGVFAFVCLLLLLRYQARSGRDK